MYGDPIGKSALHRNSLDTVHASAVFIKNEFCLVDHIIFNFEVVEVFLPGAGFVEPQELSRWMKLLSFIKGLLHDASGWNHDVHETVDLLNEGLFADSHGLFELGVLSDAS